MLLSIVIPVYNECDRLPRIIEQVETVVLPKGIDREILIVDDHSTDGTTDLLRSWQVSRPHLSLYFHDRNQGKGAALRTAMAHAYGDIILIQDADLEYNPGEYPRLLQPMIDGRADVVYGSRFIGECHRVLYFWHSLGNRCLTMLSNLMSNINLTDMECCYKVFRREILEHLMIEEDRFGFEPEITAKIARMNIRIYEVPVSYAGRTYGEGKKINWRDGVSAVRCILLYNLRAIRHGYRFRKPLAPLMRHAADVAPYQKAA